MDVTAEQIVKAITYAESTGHEHAATWPDVSRMEIGATKYQILVGYITSAAGMDNDEVKALLSREVAA